MDAFCYFCVMRSAKALSLFVHRYELALLRTPKIYVVRFWETPTASVVIYSPCHFNARSAYHLQGKYHCGAISLAAGEYN